MSENQQNWIIWARTFQHWGIKDGVAWLLENAGAMSLLVAQIIYLSQPLLSGIISPSSLNDFVHILENPVERLDFISFLRETPIRGTSA